MIDALVGIENFTLDSVAGDSIVEMHHKPCREYLGIVNNAKDVLHKLLGHKCRLDPGIDNAE